MRKPDYKALHKPSGKMFTVLEMSNKGATKLTGQGRTTSICIQCKDLPCYDPYVWEHDCILLEFTGLTDSKEVKIYEGDILKHSSRKRDYYLPIVFEEGQFKHKDPGLPFTEHFKFGEVVGNIFETPHLLDKED